LRHFYTTQQCDRQTDGRTDGRKDASAVAKTRLALHAVAGKKRLTFLSTNKIWIKHQWRRGRYCSPHRAAVLLVRTLARVR